MIYESLCKKIGFDPIKDDYQFPHTGHEDDRFESPFKVLSDEELKFFVNYFIAHRDQLTKYIVSREDDR